MSGFDRASWDRQAMQTTSCDDELRSGILGSVRKRPLFVYDPEFTVEVPDVGEVTVVIAYGGSFYTHLSAAEAGVTIEPDEIVDLICVGSATKTPVNDAIAIEYPEDDDLGILHGTIFTTPSDRDGVDSRNVCIFADGEVDRSPIGTGVSGRLAG